MTTDVWDDSRERGRGPVGSSMSDDDADGADGGAVRARGVARGQDGCMKEGPPMARFYVHGVLMYAYSDGMVMMGGDELRSWFADVGADAARAVARGAPAQAGPISTRDSEGPGGPRGTGSNSMVAAAAAADALAADRRPPPGLEAEVPRAVQQCASAPRPDPARAGAASGAALGSTATAAAPTSPVASVASELQLLSEIFASRQQVGELALQQVRASDQQVQLMQQLTQLVQNQLAHIGMLTEAIEGMREADKERGDELRQLRAMVAAQQQQLGAGALLWRSDPGFLAELPAGSSVEGRDEAQEAAPVLAATNLSSLEGLQAGEAAVRQAGERPRDVVRRNASSSTVACGGGGSGLVACVRFRCRKLTPPRPPCRMLHVHAGVAVPGTLSKLQHSPAPSRVRNPHAMRVGVVAGRARGSDGLCLGMAVHPCCHCAPLSFASNKDVGLRTPVCRVLVVSRCVRDACHRVAECRSGGLGSGRKPVVSVCVKRAS